MSMPLCDIESDLSLIKTMLSDRSVRFNELTRALLYLCAVRSELSAAITAQRVFGAKLPLLVYYRRTDKMIRRVRRAREEAANERRF